MTTFCPIKMRWSKYDYLHGLTVLPRCTVNHKRLIKMFSKNWKEDKNFNFWHKNIVLNFHNYIKNYLNWIKLISEKISYYLGCFGVFIDFWFTYLLTYQSIVKPQFPKKQNTTPCPPYLTFNHPFPHSHILTHPLTDSVLCDRQSNLRNLHLRS